MTPLPDGDLAGLVPAPLNEDQARAHLTHLAAALAFARTQAADARQRAKGLATMIDGLATIYPQLREHPELGPLISEATTPSPSHQRRRRRG